MAGITNDMDSLREELGSHFSEIEKGLNFERKAGESKLADSSRLEVSSIDENNLMATSDTEARLLVIDKEIHDLCCELTALVANGSYDIPKSTLHGLYSLVRALSQEWRNGNLRVMKGSQQQKALQNKINLLDTQIKSMETALKGVESKLEKIENLDKNSSGIPPKLQEEYTNTRNILHKMIDKFYPNDEERMKNLLKDLTIAHFSDEENQWVDVDGHYQEHVEKLLRDSIIESKPEEPHLVRFCI